MLLLPCQIKPLRNRTDYEANNVPFTSRKGSALLAAALTFIALLTACGTEESIESLKKKAQAGDAEAQFNLGVAYDDGYSVPENDVEAVKWYRKAAEQGHAIAQIPPWRDVLLRRSRVRE